MVKERTHSKRVSASRPNASPEAIRQAKNSRSHQRNMERKRIRREEAEQRNSAWASLSPKTQLVDLTGRRGNSARQKARISAQMS